MCDFKYRWPVEVRPWRAFEARVFSVGSGDIAILGVSIGSGNCDSHNVAVARVFVSSESYAAQRFRWRQLTNALQESNSHRSIVKVDDLLYVQTISFMTWLGL